MEARFRVRGMDCASCITKIETAIEAIPGVDGARILPGSDILIVEVALPTAKAEVFKRIKQLGYDITAQRKSSSAEEGHDSPGSDHLHADDEDAPLWRSRKALLTVACGLSLVGAYLVGKLSPPFANSAFVVATAIGLLPIAMRAVSAARYGTLFSIEMLMTVAAIGAVIIGAAEEAGAVVFLFLIGELLENLAASRARSSIRALSDLVPKMAYLEQGGQSRQVEASTLRIDDIILVRPGDRVPADGIILSGGSQVNEAPVTGESVPKSKQEGDAVFAGTINGDAALRVRVTASAQDNTIARVVRLVEEAQEAKAPTERLIDRFSTYYTPVVALIALFVAILPPLVAGGAWGEWIYKGLAVLLIGCPCALVISVPAAIAASLSAGAKQGLLLKGGAALESARKVTMACFDKTGTLTQGKPVVTDLHPVNSDERALLAMAAAIEAGSSHPLALAILAKAKELNLDIPAASNQQSHGGKGVSGDVEGKRVMVASPNAARANAALPADLEQRIASFNDEGKTVSVVLVGEAVLGLIAMRDEPREDAQQGLALLRARGIKTLMLTGDNGRTAAAIGQTLGIEPRAELLPQEKLDVVQGLQRQGEIVAKIGDGINDAPALAAADLGIAMGGGTDVALETADAAALHSRVSDIAAIIELSRTAITNVRQNIFMALGLKTVFLVTTVIGVTGLWPAILADTGATVLVTANALRLLRWKPNW